VIQYLPFMSLTSSGSCLGFRKSVVRGLTMFWWT